MTQAEYLAWLSRRAETYGCFGLQAVPDTSLSEADLHEEIFSECRRRGWIALHGAMSERTHRTAGEWDFIILADRGRVFLIECKSAKGKLSTDQSALHAWARKLGHTVFVVRSFEEFLQIL